MNDSQKKGEAATFFLAATPHLFFSPFTPIAPPLLFFFFSFSFCWITDWQQLSAVPIHFTLETQETKNIMFGVVYRMVDSLNYKSTYKVA